ncbi:uncharacterized protein LOC126975632 isoform X1 [Leptidea sinapis]|uniref:uncharacterized protein LOC126975632 isoform X1 n=1 Tax=Leptidea sinapis TaxID=189913 RepID=UPI00213DE7BF|nr:uncharacterized protein LOC126975632 isoform X1 [Leptidea sinapis]
MRKSLVWRFFERITNQNGRCISVVCKLCDNRHKFFGNTTNLRSHLTRKHPLQWELLSTNENLDEYSKSSNQGLDDEQSGGETPRKRRHSRAFRRENVRYSISVNKNQDSTGGDGIPVIKVDVLNETDTEQVDDDTQATINLVKQMEDANTDEEWLNDEMFETVECGPQPKKRYRHIKRETGSPRLIPTYSLKSTELPKKQIVINNSKDEYTAFGEYVSNKLRKFTNNQTKSNIQQLITTILWQAEYGIYDSMETVKRIILHSVQEMGDHSKPMQAEHDLIEVSELRLDDKISEQTVEITTDEI